MDNILTIEKKWSIGDRDFTQSPFGLDRTTALFSLAGELIGSLDKDDQELLLKTDTSEITSDIKLFSLLLKKAPKFVAGFIYLCLDVNSEKDCRFIDKNLKPIQTIAILTEFVKTNDIKEIKESFLILSELMKSALSK